MAFTIPEALKRITNPMTAAILKSIVTTDELGALISIQPESGTGIKLDREGTLPSTTFIPDTGVSTEESSGTDDTPEVQFRRIVGNLDVDLLSDAGDPSAQNRLIGKKAKATWRLMKDKLINGGHTTGHNFGNAPTAASIPLALDGGITYSAHLDSARRGPGSIRYTHAGTLWSFRAPGDRDFGTPVEVATDLTVTLKSDNPSYFISATIDASDVTADDEVPIFFTSSNDEYDGLWEMADPALVSPIVGASGDAFSLTMLDDLIDVQKIREQRAFLMNGKLVNKFYAALRALGGIDPQHITIPGYAGQVPTYRGIPILTDDNITSYVATATAVSDMALVSLSPDEGLVLGAQTAGGAAGAFSPDADPRVRPVLGFRITALGELEGKDARRTRVKWYGAPVLKSTLALAVKQGVVQ